MNSRKPIPLSVPNVSGNEARYVQECLETGWISSVGSYVSRFEEMVAAYVRSRFAVATVNGTAALHISLLLAGVKQNDYVIIPNLTFVASANAVKYLGADPILIDADPNLWQMDLDILEQFLKEETAIRGNELVRVSDGRPIRCIMPVHVLGNMCQMSRFQKIVKEFPIKVVEDASEAMGSFYEGSHAGTFGSIGCFSFNGNKIISTGGGGMIVTDDEEIARHAKHITTQAKADPVEYFHDEVGYNYRLVNVLAAIGVAQMEQLDRFLRRKAEAIAYYKFHLSGLGDIRFQEELPAVKSNGWLFTIRSESQPELLRHLNSKGIICRPFWVPMNKLPMFSDPALYKTRQNTSQQIYSTCLSIPCSTNITDEELNVVVDEIKAYF